jgi:hypothetical protein
MNYEYKENEKKNGLCVSIRDRGKNTLLEVEIKGNNVEIVTNVQNEKTTHFKMPLELFEQMYKKLMGNY